MSTQITVTMAFFTEPRSIATGEKARVFRRTVLRDGKCVSAFAPGVARAYRLQTALMRKMTAGYYTAWGKQLQAWQDRLTNANKEDHA